MPAMSGKSKRQLIEKFGERPKMGRTRHAAVCGANLDRSGTQEAAPMPCVRGIALCGAAAGKTERQHPPPPPPPPFFFI